MSDEPNDEDADQLPTEEDAEDDDDDPSSQEGGDVTGEPV